MQEQLSIHRSRFPRARPGASVAVSATAWLQFAPVTRVIAPHRTLLGQQAMGPGRNVVNAFAYIILLALAALTIALLAGCGSTTEINGAWVSAEAGKRSSINNVLVIGINRDATARRIHEDAIVAQFVAHGIKAQPSYTLLIELGQVPPLDIKSLVRNAGVDAVLVSRTVAVTTETRVTPGHFDGPAVFYRMWGSAFSTAPNVYTVKNVEVETGLFDVKDFALMWSVSSTTHPTSSMQQTISEFAAVLVKALADARVTA